MPIVARRLFATSRGSKSSAKRPQGSKSAFADRFGLPDKQPPYPQSSFPTWPSPPSPQQVSPRPSSYALLRPPPNLLTPLNNGKEDKSRSEKESGSHAFQKQRTGELFSDIIGNVSELVKTASFEAKLAIQPAMETRRQQLLAAKNNIHRFKALPPPAQHTPDQEEPASSEVTSSNTGDSSITKPDGSSSSPSKANSRTVRPLPISPPGHRMLSTFSIEPSSAPFTVVPSPIVADDWVVQTPRSPSSLETPTRPPPSSPANSKAPCVLVPAPTTSLELCNAMRHLIQSTTPRLQVPRLISTHSQYPTLHTATSFNVLLAYAARVAPRYVRPITAQMRASGTAWDARTQKLVVRAHIQAGQWLQAIELAEKTWLVDGASGASTMPLDVFTELMHFVLTPKSSQEDVAAMARRCWRLFPAHANATASPRLAYNVVRLLVNQGHVGQAVQLTKRLLESLSYTTPGTTRYCCAILGLVIRPRERSTRRSGPYRTPPFRERLELFESLLTHNPSLGLTPDAKLTRCLLENLFRSRSRGSIAFHKLGELRAKYGPVVEDSAVRRLIARYAMQEGKFELARAMREREELARDEPVEAFAASARAGSGSKEAPWVGDEPILMQSHLEYIRRVGAENIKWTELSRNLRRAEEKRRPADLGNARAADEGGGKRGRAWYNRLQRKRKRVLKRARKMTNI
ncbi:hypothetical protein FRC10_004012 [Ceratobasidium sp. 414]|nr:hypothetical protein FRC10_004012 [Ceratobasidium sp. 414]